MKINIELNTQSIEQAIKKLNQIKKLYTKGTLIKDFLEDVCIWIINRANWYIENADLGELVKLQIRNGWEYDISNNFAKIVNRAEKAVFVEFGVGIVGQENSHPNSTKSGYEYNIPSPYKDENGMWYFWTNSAELDIPKTSLEDIRGYDDFRGEQGKRIVVGTRGAEGVMYAYNAIVDAKMELRNPTSELSQKWKKQVERYIG